MCPLVREEEFESSTELNFELEGRHFSRVDGAGNEQREWKSCFRPIVRVTIIDYKLPVLDPPDLAINASSPRTAHISNTMKRYCTVLA
jgi:hypothetical protein